MNPYEPILSEISNGMLENAEIKPNFSNNALLDATLIFQTVLIDKIFDCQDFDNMPMKYRSEMATSAGNELRKLIKTYTNLDTFDLVNDYDKRKQTTN